MDYTMLVNLLWDLGTGIAVGLLACGAWACLEHRFAADDVEESTPHATPTRSMPIFII